MHLCLSNIKKKYVNETKIDRMIVACHRPSNLVNILLYRRLKARILPPTYPLVIARRSPIYRNMYRERDRDRESEVVREIEISHLNLFIFIFMRFRDSHSKFRKNKFHTLFANRRNIYS